MEKEVFQDSEWPKAIRNDRKALFKVDRRHFYEMIKPLPYPDDYPHLLKIDRMEESVSEFADLEDLHKKKKEKEKKFQLLKRLDLYVTFEDKRKNHVGVPQPKCTACGNCVGGCNVGSKNTLNMNYLPDAKAHGAELFTEVIHVMNLFQNLFVVSYQLFLCKGYLSVKLLFTCISNGKKRSCYILDRDCWDMDF